MPRVVHFEVITDDPERAARFYSKVFNWKIEKWAGPVDYWLVYTGSGDEAGIDGAIRYPEAAHTQSVINTISVPSVDDFTKKIVASGGKVASPKAAIPGVGYHAYCQDTEGNTFGIIQDDKSAR